MSAEQKFLEVGELAASRLDFRLRVRSLRHHAKLGVAPRLADTTTVLMIDGEHRHDDCVIILSPEAFPEVVRKAADQANKARAAVGQRLGERIHAPLICDNWEGRSFAVYRRLDPVSENRFMRRAQMLSCTPKIIDWLAEVMKASVVNTVPERVLDQLLIQPLTALASDDELSFGLKSTAQRLCEMSSVGKTRVVTCLQHGDFWEGNIMFRRSLTSSFNPTFRVIDWAGSKLNGYPAIDALRFSMSAFGKGRISEWALRSYCSKTDLSPTDFATHCLSSLGSLRGELNEFPKTSFNALAESVYEFLMHNALLGASSS